MRARLLAVPRFLLVALALLACALTAAVALAATNPSWRPAETLDGPGTLSAPRVAVDDEGNASAVWLRGGEIMARSRPVGGSWGPAEPLDPGIAAENPLIAASPGGEFVAVWEAMEGSSTALHAASRSGDGHWREESILADEEVSPSFLLRLKAGPEGSFAIAFWGSVPTTNGGVYT